MREPNLSFPHQNRASICITSAVYDRRALDSTATLPLINSLTHLAYLTSTSPRIREILSLDGGLEQLVRILSAEQQPNDLRGLWKWSLAFQCTVNIGVRGTEQIRTRVVDAGMVTIVLRVLQNFLRALEVVSREQQDQEKRQQQQQQQQQGDNISAATVAAAAAAVAVASNNVASNRPLCVSSSNSNSNGGVGGSNGGGNSSSTSWTSSDNTATATAAGLQPQPEPFIQQPDTTKPYTDHNTPSSSSSSSSSSSNPLSATTTTTTTTSTTTNNTNTISSHHSSSPHHHHPQHRHTNSLRRRTTFPYVKITADQRRRNRMERQHTFAPPSSTNTSLNVDNVFYREDDILMSLQLLAYLSKYPHIRDLFHTAFHTNVFSVVEKFTHRIHPKPIQYWAGVIMRNGCRKDETRGGIRKCANVHCTKWEQKPREFAKCRRCRKAKYCSKECQSKAWSEGHRWWCVEKPSTAVAAAAVVAAAAAATTTTTSTPSNTTNTQPQPQPPQTHHHHTQPPLPTTRPPTTTPPTTTTTTSPAGMPTTSAEQQQGSPTPHTTTADTLLSLH